MEQENKIQIEPNFIGLTPIIAFALIIAIPGLITGNFSTMPLLTGFVFATGYALLLNPKVKKISLGEKVNYFCKAGGEKTLILLIVIYLLAGSFYSVTIAIGARDATVNLGLNNIPKQLLLPGMFFISCIISFAMGTSMGTVTAVSPIAIGLAEKVGASPSLMMGIVLGGAMFGDNLSFISDTTIAATRTQNVNMIDKFKTNIFVVTPAVIVTLIITAFVPIHVDEESLGASYNIILVLPYLLIVILAALKLNVITVLATGVASGCVIGLIYGIFDFPQMFATIQEGMGWMQDIAIITIFVGGITGLMKAYGGVEWILQSLTKNLKSKKGAELAIGTLVSTLDFATGNNTVAIVATGPIAKELSRKFDIDPRRTAGLLDVFSCGFQGLSPFSVQIFTAAAFAGLSPIDIIPNVWYCMLIIVCGFLAILLGFPKFKKDAFDEFGNVVYKVNK